MRVTKTVRQESYCCVAANIQDFTSAREKVLYQKDENTVSTREYLAWFYVLMSSLPDCICKQTLLSGDDDSVHMHSDETIYLLSSLCALNRRLGYRMWKARSGREGPRNSTRR